MNVLRLLLTGVLIAGAHLACAVADPMTDPVSQAAAPNAKSERLPPASPVGSESGEPAKPIEAAPESSTDVSPAAYEEFLTVEDYVPATPRVPVSGDAPRLFESTWYTRIDYFYWGEQVDHRTFMQNNGAAPTLGWQQRHGRQRYRAELFGAKVDYSADLGGYDGSNVTNYLGLRAEYELMFEPENWERLSFFGGVGTRFFVRSIPDIFLAPTVVAVGYQESWWTFYPYVGAESRRKMNTNWEPYWRARIGLTAFTREHIADDDVTLFPRPNLTGQIELGYRGPRWFVSAYSEVMAWSRSARVLDYQGGGTYYYVNQPNSQNVMLGLKSGWSY